MIIAKFDCIGVHRQGRGVCKRVPQTANRMLAWENTVDVNDNGRCERQWEMGMAGSYIVSYLPVQSDHLAVRITICKNNRATVRYSQTWMKTIELGREGQFL